MIDVLIPFGATLIAAAVLGVTAIRRGHRIMELEAELRESLDYSKHYKACPSVAPEQFARRAEVYRRKYRDAALTPSALCAHWAECDAGYVPAVSRVPDVEPAPDGWREKLEVMCPGNLHNADGRPWETLDASIRAKLLLFNP